MPFGCDFDSSISDVYSLRLLFTVYSRQNNQWPQNPSELKTQQSMNLSYFEIRFTSKNIYIYHIIISYHIIITYNKFLCLFIIHNPCTITSASVNIRYCASIKYLISDQITLSNHIISFTVHGHSHSFII